MIALGDSPRRVATSCTVKYRSRSWLWLIAASQRRHLRSPTRLAKPIGPKLLTRHAAPLAPRLRQPRITESPIAATRERPLPALDTRSSACRPTPRITRLATVRPAQLVLVPCLSQHRERRRIPPTLR